MSGFCLLGHFCNKYPSFLWRIRSHLPKCWKHRGLGYFFQPSALGPLLYLLPRVGLISYRGCQPPAHPDARGSELQSRPLVSLAVRDHQTHVLSQAAASGPDSGSRGCSQDWWGARGPTSQTAETSEPICSLLIACSSLLLPPGPF